MKIGIGNWARPFASVWRVVVFTLVVCATGGVWAATPVVVWDGSSSFCNFSTLTQEDYTLNLNSQNTVSTDYSYVQIGSDNKKAGVTITSGVAGAFGTAGELTVIIVCDSLMHDQANRAIIGLTKEDGNYSANFNTDIKFAIATGYSGFYTYLKDGVYAGYGAKLSYDGRHTMALTYSSETGGEGYFDGSRYAQYSDVAESSFTSPSGVVLGGLDVDNSTKIYAQTGMKIYAVAIFNTKLTAEEIAAYKFPNEYTATVSSDTSWDDIDWNGGADWSVANENTTAQLIVENNSVITLPSTLTAKSINVNGGTIKTTGDTSITAELSGSAALEVEGSSTLTLNRTINITGGTTVSSGAVLKFNASGTYAYSSLISGAGSVEVAAGTVTFSGSNSYTGNLTVKSGAVAKAGSNAAFGADWDASTTRRIIVENGGVADVNGQADMCYGYNIAGDGTGNGALINSGSEIDTGHKQTTFLELSADASVGGSNSFGLLASGWGDTTLNLNDYILKKLGTNKFYLINTTINVGSQGKGRVNISSGTVRFGRKQWNDTDADFFTGSGTLELTDNGADTLFEKNSEYSGLVRVEKGNKYPVFSGSASFSNCSGFKADGDFALDTEFKTTTFKINNLSGSGRIQPDWGDSGVAATRTVETTQTKETTFSGVFNKDSVNKRISGLVVNGSNSGDGVLKLSGNNVTTGQLTVQNNAKVVLTSTGKWAGPVQVDNSGCLQVESTSALSGIVTLNGGATVVLPASVPLMAGGVVIPSDGTIRVDLSAFGIANDASATIISATTLTGGANVGNLQATSGHYTFALDSENSNAIKATNVSSCIWDGSSWNRADPSLYSDVTVNVVAGGTTLTLDDDYSFDTVTLSGSSGTLTIEANGHTLTVGDIVIPEGVTLTSSSVLTITGTISGDGTLNIPNGVTLTLDGVECSAKITAQNGGTLITKGATELSNENNNFAYGSLINVLTGKATVNAHFSAYNSAGRGFHGNITIAKGATFVNSKTESFDCNADSSHPIVVDVYGTLSMGSTRWTLGNYNTIKLHEDATITGEGDSSSNGALNGALDVENNVTTFKIIADGNATVTANVRIRNKMLVEVSDGKNLTFSGSLISYGDGSIMEVVSGQVTTTTLPGFKVKIDEGATFTLKDAVWSGSDDKFSGTGTLELLSTSDNRTHTATGSTFAGIVKLSNENGNECNLNPSGAAMFTARPELIANSTSIRLGDGWLNNLDHPLQVKNLSGSGQLRAQWTSGNFNYLVDTVQECDTDYTGTISCDVSSGNRYVSFLVKGNNSSEIHSLGITQAQNTSNDNGCKASTLIVSDYGKVVFKSAGGWGYGTVVVGNNGYLQSESTATSLAATLMLEDGSTLSFAEGYSLQVGAITLPASGTVTLDVTSLTLPTGTDKLTLFSTTTALDLTKFSVTGNSDYYLQQNAQDAETNPGAVTLQLYALKDNNGGYYRDATSALWAIGANHALTLTILDGTEEDWTADALSPYGLERSGTSVYYVAATVTDSVSGAVVSYRSVQAAIDNARAENGQYVTAYQSETVTAAGQILLKIADGAVVTLNSSKAGCAYDGGAPTIVDGIYMFSDNVPVAATFKWNPAVASGLWGNTDNWTSDDGTVSRMPGSLDTVIFESAAMVETPGSGFSFAALQANASVTIKRDQWAIDDGLTRTVSAYGAISGTGSLTLNDGVNLANASGASLSIGVPVTVAGATALTVAEGVAASFTGSGTLTLDAITSTPIVGDGWRGTVWLKNQSGIQIIPANYGNANSVIRFTGITGWIADGTTCSPAFEFVDEGNTKALTLNSYSTTTPSTITFNEFRGSGTFATVGGTADAYPRTNFRILKWDDFVGSLDVDRGRAVFGTDTISNDDWRYIYISEDADVTIAAGKSFTANQGLRVYGELTVESNNALSSTAVQGSGTIIYEVAPNNGTTKPSFHATLWTGTVELPSYSLNGEKFNNYGNSNSKVRINGYSGWLGWTQTGNPTNKSRHNPTLDIAGSFAITAWSQYDYTFDKVTGSGSMTFSSGAPNSLTITKLEVPEGFNGVCVTNNTSKALTIGTLTLPSLPTCDQKILSVGGTGSISLDISDIKVGESPLPAKYKLERRHVDEEGDGFYVYYNGTIFSVW